MQIGELSKRTGYNIETIRYYERIALLPAPARSAARYRVYGAGDVRRLVFVRRARELGFTLDAVRALLALSDDDGSAACAQVRRLAASHLAERGTRENSGPSGNGVRPGGCRAALRCG